MNDTAENMTFFEDLSEVDTCPPNDAIIPNGVDEFFRVVKNEPASSDCFVSNKKKNPHKEFADECIARAVSLSDSLEGLLNAYFKTPAHKKKTRLIGVLALNAKDGRIKQTFAAGHYSWWRSSVFEPGSVNIKKVER